MSVDQAGEAAPVRRGEIRKLIVLFFAVLLVLTFFSKTIANLTLPVVRVETPTSGSLIKEITGKGLVAARQAVGLYSRERRRVVELHVTVGASVRAGQILVVLELGSYAEAFAHGRATIGPGRRASMPCSV
jgi:multidrug efflux pump subunit AcrA (membrane-fusion protein)